MDTHTTSVIPGIDAVDPELPEAGEVDHTVGNDGPVLVAAVRPGVNVDTVETVERDSVADTGVGPVVSDVGEPSDVVLLWSLAWICWIHLILIQMLYVLRLWVLRLAMSPLVSIPWL